MCTSESIFSIEHTYSSAMQLVKALTPYEQSATISCEVARLRHDNTPTLKHSMFLLFAQLQY